ncbi:MAG: HAD family phosphatase [Selenomonadaceae bacterium]|nr:HAD family phosphatase [Selenomonadaceae bacterium]
MRYKLLAFDMDGTILNSEKKITPATVTKLEELSKRGVYVVVSTGRGLAELVDYKKDFQFVQYGILISGGIIYNFNSAQVLSIHPVAKDLIFKLIDAGLDEGAMIHLLTLKNSIAAQKDIEQMEKFHMGIYQKMFDKICVRCDDFKKYVYDNPEKVLKVNLYHLTQESRDRTVERMKNFDLQLVFAEGTSLEASPKNITKGSGLRELCKILKISVDECVAIGDGFNDLEILQTAGLAVAMGNACEEIKKIADYVTDDNDHDGVLKAIEKFFSKW